MNRRRTVRYILFGVLLLLVLNRDTVLIEDEVTLRLPVIVRPYGFNLYTWEADSILEKLHDKLLGHTGRGLEEGEALRLVENYFALQADVGRRQREIDQLYSQREQEETQHLADLERELSEVRRQRDRLEDQVEAILAGQVQQTLHDEDITYHLLGRFRVVFPPVTYEVERPPNLLVISPRERIERKAETYLRPDLTTRQIELIEAAVDRLGVSSLVVPLGGFSTYPPMVLETSSRSWTISTIAHEWLHTYLFFQPLGWRYATTGDLVTMNETVADIAGNEIGQIVEFKYYGGPPPELPPLEEPQPTELPSEGEFDFNREMRRIRLRVDELLAEGKVEEAEAFMEERRQFLSSKGHHLRKLNQAYFAFYGSYPDAPGAVSPIGGDMKLLRRHSSSLAAFIKRVAGMTSYDELSAALGE